MTKAETLSQAAPILPSDADADADADAVALAQAHAQDHDDRGKENRDRTTSKLAQPQQDDVMIPDEKPPCEGEKQEAMNKDQDARALCKADDHPWLEQLFMTVFFDNCSQHAGNKQERKYFCKKTSQSLCFYCLRNHEYGEEDIIQVRRYVYNDVLRIEDISPYMDVSGIQPYVINGCKALMLRKKLRSRTAKPDSHACQSCRRSLGEEYTWCCLSCKYYGSESVHLQVNAAADPYGSEDCTSIEETQAYPRPLPHHRRHVLASDKCDTPTSSSMPSLVIVTAAADEDEGEEDEEYGASKGDRGNNGSGHHRRLRARRRNHHYHHHHHRPLESEILEKFKSPLKHQKQPPSTGNNNSRPKRKRGGGGLTCDGSQAPDHLYIYYNSRLIYYSPMSPQRLKHPRKTLPTRSPLF